MCTDTREREMRMRIKQTLITSIRCVCVFDWPALLWYPQEVHYPGVKDSSAQSSNPQPSSLHHLFLINRQQVKGHSTNYQQTHTLTSALASSDIKDFVTSLYFFHCCIIITSHRLTSMIHLFLKSHLKPHWNECQFWWVYYEDCTTLNIKQ